jgi:hypothetical protein
VNPEARWPREIAPGIWWLGGCNATDAFGGGLVHVHVSPYLIVGESSTLLVDAGLPAHWGQLAKRLDEVLGDRPLDWCVPTHYEVAHAGNLRRILERYPDLKVAGDIRDYHLMFPNLMDRFGAMSAGSKVDLGGGYEFVSLPAPIKDLPSTIWGYESSQRVLFPADAFSFAHHPPLDGGDAEEDESAIAYHLPGECAKLSSELEVAPSVDQAAFLTKSALYWTQYTPVEPFFAEVFRLLEQYPARILAPTHGNVIDDLAGILPTVLEAHRLAYTAPGRLR